ncbi:50S ribosomal protein L30 [Pelagibacteraceae bacterium]|jgi:large subunit ribosomal protein L30|nr:50S ribosomal protein L30 [Pelagibacteraceae bacterium]MDC3143686.1 50S ribosomal protein L30 [Pelagibacteraceae bacterium]|tara:strand:- start:5295 stop:5477 length:183 start_codon:yes stop_codon:yes gene_type:complete
MSQKIKITQIKSSIGSVQKTIGTLRGLGLKKIQSTSILIETPEVLGMIKKVQHLVKTEKV